MLHVTHDPTSPSDPTHYVLLRPRWTQDQVEPSDRMIRAGERANGQCRQRRQRLERGVHAFFARPARRQPSHHRDGGEGRGETAAPTGRSSLPPFPASAAPRGRRKQDRERLNGAAAAARPGRGCIRAARPAEMGW